MGLLIWRFVKEPERRNAEAVSQGRAKLSDYFSILRFRNVWLCCIGAIGFMTWMWLSATIILIGAELNSEIESQARPGGKPGETGKGKA